MAEVTFKGTPIHTVGTLPEVGEQAQDFKLKKTDLSEVTLDAFKGKRLLLNIFPSLDTGTCAMSVRKFNEAAAKMNNTAVLCISRDLPFAQKRFCGAEGIENVIALSDFAERSFGKDYGVELKDGPLESLLSRAVVVVDEHGTVVYREQVPEISEEPNYDAALKYL